MANPAYNILEVSIIAERCVKSNDRKSLAELIDIMIEDDKLYTEGEVSIIAQILVDSARRLGTEVLPGD